MHDEPSITGRRCDGMRRRDFLHVGFLTALGIGLDDAFRWRARAADASGGPRGRARSCILLWLDGGPSHLDTFDPKPGAPVEVRSPFGTVASAIPGVHLCEHLPRTARALGDVALVRSLTHELGNHDTGTRFLLTGRRPNPALEYPSLGSVVARRAGLEAALPPYVAIPGDSVGGQSSAAGPGYLPAAFSAFSVGNDPGRVRDLSPPAGVSFGRTERRREMRARLDAFSRAGQEAGAVRDRDAFYEQAYRLLASPGARGAFDVDREPAPVREAYGRSKLGTGCLLARRLVEAGTRFVTVVDTGWDTHGQIARELPDSRFPGSGKLPALDQAYSALLADLRRRGLLESTLVVLMGEFGRTPKLNAAGGRDHWPRAGFACLAGGGIRGGQVLGATDAFGESPTERPVGPPDLAWTILELLGIDPATEWTTPAGRPVRLLDEGSLIRELV